MKKWLKRIFIFLLIGFVVIQFVRIDKSFPEYEKSGDFIEMHQPSKEVAAILVNACYDCHSYETKYPWYAEIAPISWWVGGHIEEGREHLNFSVWDSYDVDKQAHKVEECIEEIEEDKMPDPNYIKMHAEAKLSEENKQALLNFLKLILYGSPTAAINEYRDDYDQR